MTRDFYRQHHELDAPEVDGQTFRPFWRRRSRIDTLLADSAIAPIVWRAAVAYRMLAEHSTAVAWGARETMDDGHSRIVPLTGQSVVDRLAARHRLEWIRRRLGSFGTRMINQVVIEDLPWSELGRRLAVDPKTARSWSITALQLLPAVMFTSRR